MLKGIKRKIYGGLILIALLIAVALVGVLRLEIDLAQVIWACTGLFGLYIIFSIVHHLQKPKEQVHISHKIELKSPPRLLKPFKNYRFKISSEKHIERKGEWRIVKMDELIMTFDEKEHPDIYAYCMELIRGQQEVAESTVRLAHPHASITSKSLVLPESLKKLAAKGS